jgi:glutamyl-tRNA reductase
MPTVTALRAHADDVVAKVLAENAGRWETLSERDRKRVEALARAVANRLLHEPTLRVKGLDAAHRHARLQLLRELFGLEDAAPESAEQPAEIRTLRPR